MKRIYLFLSLFAIIFLTACQINSNIEDNEQNTYDLTFIVDDTVYHTYKVLIGDTIIFPDDPIKDGYIFEGWFVNDTEFTSSIVFYSALTLTAKFSEVPQVLYHHVYFYDQETLIKTALVEDNKTLAGHYPSTVKSGYSFKGWFTNQAMTDIYSPLTLIKNDLTLFGKWEVSSTPDTTFTGYYQTLNDKSGDQLYQALETLLMVRNIRTYGDARYLLEDSDLAVGSSNQLWLIYNGANVLNIWDGGVSFDREHVWPVSLLGVPRPENSTKSMATDAHNLRASTPSVNGARGNLSFAEGSGTNKAVSGGYYPGDQHKGDVARIILYMHVGWDIAINVGNLNTFLKWHEEDPVDQFEINRNNVIYTYQNNRNPFIDHPELTSYLWQSSNLSTPLSISYQTFTFTSIG